MVKFSATEFRQLQQSRGLYLFEDLPQAKVYAAVAGFAHAFLAIERQAFVIFWASLDAVDNR